MASTTFVVPDLRLLRPSGELPTYVKRETKKIRRAMGVKSSSSLSSLFGSGPEGPELEG